MAFFLIVASVGTRPVAASHGPENWPQFRGPDGQGHAGDAGIPSTWSETSNIIWKKPVPGHGWSSPVVEGDEIWLTTSLKDGHELYALCMDRNDGGIRHNVMVFAVAEPAKKHAKNSYASPTPVIDGDRVYVHFGTYGTAALDRRSGRVLWRMNDLKIDHEVGPGGSPALYENLLLLTYDGTDRKFTAALDKETGRVVWRRERPPIENTSPEMQKAFSTPLVINVGGVDQMITTAADQGMAQDPRTGGIIWSIRYVGFSCAPRAVYGGGLVYLCTGFGTSEVLAVKVDGRGDVTGSNIVWRVGRQAPTNPSPILDGGELYIVSDKGIATCLDARSGGEIWKERLGGNYSASPVMAKGRIFFFNEEGESTVIEAGRTYKKLGTNRLDSGFMASPAIVGDTLYLRTEDHLYRIEETAQ